MKLITLFLLSCVAAFGAVWAPPATNQGSWVPGTNVGIPGGCEQYAASGASDRAVTGTVINITSAPYSADNTGTTECQTAVNAAITAASGTTVIYFPAGTYKFTGPCYSGYKDNITFRGAGISSTTLVNASTALPVFQFTQPGGMDNNFQTVTGTKTKGTAVLSVNPDTDFTVGRIISVQIENEVDTARITAGADPTFISTGTPWARQMLAIVTANGTNSVTIDPPLPTDCTNLAVRLGTDPFSVSTNGWGFEDFTVQNSAAQDWTGTNNMPQFLVTDLGANNWIYRVNFTGFNTRTSASGYIRWFNQYQGEIRKCTFTSTTGASDDGAIETYFNSSNLFVDNIFTFWNQALYCSGRCTNDVVAYNYCDGILQLFHDPHPSLNLFEGNYATYHFSDGYHGSSSQNTLFRNTYTSGVVLNRFKRHYCIAGNVLGGATSYGNPNIGNGDAHGFAGPTGTSDQVGQTDYLQDGVGPNTYVIQPGDVSVGDFWQDWEITGTLTTRTDATHGIFTVSGGNWFTGSSPTGGNRLYPTVHWNSKANTMYTGEVTNVAGSLVTIEWLSGTLPAASTAVQLYMFAPGWQERDLDVQATTALAANSYAGTYAAESLGSDTLPSSLIYGSKPAWFYGLSWPPFSSSSAAAASADDIPAGYRALNSGADPSGGGGSNRTTHSGSGRTTRSGSGRTTRQ